jgi:hypothetical protein
VVTILTSGKPRRRMAMATAATITTIVNRSAIPIDIVGQFTPQRSLKMTACPNRNRGTATSPIWKRKKIMVYKGLARQPTEYKGISQ